MKKINQCLFVIFIAILPVVNAQPNDCGNQKELSKILTENKQLKNTIRQLKQQLSEQITVKNVTTIPINTKQGMQYKTARKTLLGNGWQMVTMKTLPNGTPVCYDYAYSNGCDGFYEVEDCSGTGMGFCLMFFYDGDKTYLKIVTSGGAPADAHIVSWKKIGTEEIAAHREIVSPEKLY